jgi:hypothetical protein
MPTRTELPFLHLKDCAHFHLKESENPDRNTFHASMSCIVFSALTLEAFLNYAGSCVFDFWEELERHLTPINKLNVICSQLRIPTDFSSRPFQSFEKAVNLKHYLNQGKIDSYSRASASVSKRTEWEKQCIPAEARKVYDDMLQIMDTLSREMEGGIYPLSVQEFEDQDLFES